MWSTGTSTLTRVPANIYLFTIKPNLPYIPNTKRSTGTVDTWLLLLLEQLVSDIPVEELCGLLYSRLLSVESHR